MAVLATAEANRANTAERERLQIELGTAEDEKRKLGPIPKDVDPGAAKIGMLLAKFIDMGDRPDLVVMDWGPHVFAGFIELIGLLVPRIILTALGIVERRSSRLHLFVDLLRQLMARWPERAAPGVPQPPAAPIAAVGTQGVATAAKPKIKPAAVGDSESVRQWYKSCAIERAGGKVKPKAEAYEGSYVPWCEERGIEPVSFTKFGTIIKAPVAEGGCGVGFEHNASKRDFYLGIALVTSPRLAVVGGNSRLRPMARNG